MIEVEIQLDATREEIRFTPIGNGRYSIIVPSSNGCLMVRISEEQALSLYKLLRLYLRSLLARWGPEAVAGPVIEDVANG